MNSTNNQYDSTEIRNLIKILVSFEAMLFLTYNFMTLNSERKLFVLLCSGVAVMIHLCSLHTIIYFKKSTTDIVLYCLEHFANEASRLYYHQAMNKLKKKEKRLVKINDELKKKEKIL